MIDTEQLINVVSLGSLFIVLPANSRNIKHSNTKINKREEITVKNYKKTSANICSLWKDDVPLYTRINLDEVKATNEH